MKTKRYAYTLPRKFWLHCQIFTGLLVLIVSSPLANATTVKEGEGETMEIEFKLPGPVSSGLRIKYDYSTENNAAKAGDDYTAVSGTIVFEQFQQTKKIYINILDDSVDRECEEDFYLHLKNARSQWLGGTIYTYNPCWNCGINDYGQRQCQYCTSSKTFTGVILDRTDSYFNQHYGSCYTGSTYGE